MIWRDVVAASVAYRFSTLPNDWMSSHSEQVYQERNKTTAAAAAAAATGWKPMIMMRKSKVRSRLRHAEQDCGMGEAKHPHYIILSHPRHEKTAKIQYGPE